LVWGGYAPNAVDVKKGCHDSRSRRRVLIVDVCELGQRVESYYAAVVGWVDIFNEPFIRNHTRSTKFVYFKLPFICIHTYLWYYLLLCDEQGRGRATVVMKALPSTA